MIFNFISNNPKERLKEFGSFKWLKNNVIQIAIQTLLLLSLAIYTGYTFLFILASLPFITVFYFMIGEASIVGAFLQSIWYLPVLFWQARNEDI